MKNIVKKFNLKASHGFTLIELLVVIAIIGLLAGIVLVSLSGARDGAKDARVVAALQQTRSIAELVYNNSSPLGYDELCETTGDTLDQGHTTYGTELGNLESDINAQNGGTDPVCYAVNDDYCISAVLATGGTACVSSSGQSGNDACGAATTACTP